MSSPASSPRAQQHATRAAFFIPGFAIAAWAPIVPFAKTRTGLDEASLGLVLLCLGTGSLLAMPMAGALAARQGCRRVMVAALLLICAALPALTLAGAPWLLAAALFAFGAGIGAMDCAMNLQAVAVERDAARPMMSGFHAFYSIGGFVGAAGMTALLSAGLAPWLAAVLVAAAILALHGPSARHWRSERLARDTAAFAWPRGVVAFIGVLCFVTFLVEGSMLDWSAVFLHEVRGVDAARAGLGFVVFSLAMTVARLLGDGLVQRLGDRRAVVLGALCACAGLCVATLVPDGTLALAGYALVGAGCANIVPVMFSMAGRQTTMPEAQAIPAISTLGYTGVLAGPALIGFVAHATGLIVAFLGVAVAIACVALSMRWLRA
ncbi:MFS transporter [Luteimonas sp. FCS-9]|uniref:MFS transporter n=1 Tax=Luteimonas sp. FCS-9 TaxID=1547516 RepID=UPI00063E8651|nr:MFS transporter [Luteimonas sp. FCS-9]KLJ00345.1 MFS transporter [Luteimonas sp. FCS-9]